MANMQMVFAADIVSELEAVLPHEVVITDSEGVVIAASDVQRVGNINKEAQSCIRSGSDE